MATTDLQPLWEAAFPDRTRPSLYASDMYDEDGFQPLTNYKDFTADLNSLSPAQMYALAANNQLALRTAQDEYMELEHQINLIKNPDPTNQQPIKDPQITIDHREYEDRKEAILYGYKYDGKRYFGHKKLSELSDMEKRDLRLEQDPFSQGGFVPNDRQFKAARVKTTNVNNIDGWVPIVRSGRKLVPRMFVETPSEQAERKNNTRSAATLGAQAMERTLTDDIDDAGSGVGTPAPVNKLLRVTRFNGTKVPLTRDASEEPSYPPSRASTPKRKRGDTPLPSVEGGSPLKKSRGSDGEVLPRRRHHNQYTKARERREQAESNAVTHVASGLVGRNGLSTRLNGLYHDADQSLSRSTTIEPPSRASPPPRRKRHNQYTKAKERAELAAAGEPLHAVRPHNEGPLHNHYPPVNGYHARDDDRFTAASPGQEVVTPIHGPTRLSQQADVAGKSGGRGQQPIWANMTAAQKLHHKWDSESLIAAIKEDYSWLPEENDALKRAERDRLLAQKNPHRSFSIKNKWRFWKKEGLDKRPRKNKVTAPSGDSVVTGDEGSGTPGSRVGMQHDHHESGVYGRVNEGDPKRVDDTATTPSEQFEDDSDDEDSQSWSKADPDYTYPKPRPRKTARAARVDND